MRKGRREREREVKEVKEGEREYVRDKEDEMKGGGRRGEKGEDLG